MLCYHMLSYLVILLIDTPRNKEPDVRAWNTVCARARKAIGFESQSNVGPGSFRHWREQISKSGPRTSRAPCSTLLLRLRTDERF